MWEGQGWWAQEAGEREPPDKDEGAGLPRAQHMSQTRVFLAGSRGGHGTPPVVQTRPSLWKGIWVTGPVSHTLDPWVPGWVCPWGGRLSPWIARHLTRGMKAERGFPDPEDRGKAAIAPQIGPARRKRDKGPRRPRPQGLDLSHRPHPGCLLLPGLLSTQKQEGNPWLQVWSWPRPFPSSGLGVLTCRMGWQHRLPGGVVSAGRRGRHARLHVQVCGQCLLD